MQEFKAGQLFVDSDGDVCVRTSEGCVCFFDDDLEAYFDDDLTDASSFTRCRPVRGKISIKIEVEE
jgi:hypothetical protein